MTEPVSVQFLSVLERLACLSRRAAASQVNNLMTRKLSLSVLGLLLAGTASADWALNMPKGVTDLSARNLRHSHAGLLVVRGYRRRRFRRDDLLVVAAPQVERCGSGRLFTQHDGGGYLDDHPVLHSCVHGRACS